MGLFVLYVLYLAAVLLWKTAFLLLAGAALALAYRAFSRILPRHREMAGLRSLMSLAGSSFDSLLDPHAVARQWDPRTGAADRSPLSRTYACLPGPEHIHRPVHLSR